MNIELSKVLIFGSWAKQSAKIKYIYLRLLLGQKYIFYSVVFFFNYSRAHNCTYTINVNESLNTLPDVAITTSYLNHNIILFVVFSLSVKAARFDHVWPSSYLLETEFIVC